MQTERYVRRPFEVEAVQVTEENYEEVATWCGGTIHSPDSGVTTAKVFIRVEVKNPQNERQTRAHIGDWILFAGKTFRVYTTNAFTRNFTPGVVAEQI